MDILIEAFAKVQQKYNGQKRLKLRIIGDGPERKKLENLVENLTLSASVEFLGNQPYEWVRSSFFPSIHIFVNPSFQEGLPTTVMEAIVSGCWVIATDVGGTRELLKKSQFTLIKAHDVSGLTYSIIQILASVALNRGS